MNEITNNNRKVYNKKTKAFTLAELLAVITILGVIALIVFPAVNKAIKNSKEKSYNQQVESILESAENWTTENMSQLSDTSDNYITIGELQQSGYLEAKKVINPITDEEMNGCIVIKYDESYNQYTYQYNETSCDDMPVERICDTEIMGRNITTGEVVCLDPDMNPRYVGTDPNNYVSFNGELWRIIGVFDGQAKIIRDEYYSTLIAWDSNKSNNWATASLKSLLNDGDTSFLKTIEANDLTSYGYIDLEHVWNIGGYNNSYQTTGTRSTFYNEERSETPAGAEGSSHLWTGAIGLMYPSDYGYSTSGFTETCEEKEMFNWGTGEYRTECAQNSWLYDSSNWQWTIIPNSSRSSLAFLVSRDGDVNGSDYGVRGEQSARPALFLKSDIKIVGGKGTEDEPYVLSME